MSVKKPSLPDPRHPAFLERAKELLEILAGRRAGKLKKIDKLSAVDLSIAPTASDYNKLVADNNVLRIKINQIIERLQDGD